MEMLLDLTVLASEEFVPPSDWRAQVAVPMAVLILLGSIYLLLRANLGTRRAYLVQASSFFGVMLFLSLFWTVGAPGTPPFTGPQNLPGQPIDYYQPKWVPFAGDSVVAEQPEYQAVQGYPETFDEVPAEQEGLAEDGAGAIQEFFSTNPADDGGDSWVIGDDWVVTATAYTVAENGRSLLAVEYTEPSEPGEAAPEGESYVAFGFFQEDRRIIPNLVFILASAAGLLLHLALLAADERRERRDLEEDLGVEAEEERVPTPV